MKRRNREVSIFSMSALDLFASALGAFILIAIVMFPYFPNTGTADQRDLDAALERLQAEEEDNEALQDVLREIREELERRLEAVRAAAEREIAEARQDAAEARQGAAEARRRLDDAEREIAEARQDAAEARQDAAEARRRLDDVEFPHIDLVIALDVTASMGDQIEGLKAEIDELAAILQRLAPSVGMGIVAFGDREWTRPLTRFPLVDIGSAANRSRLTDFVGSMSANMGMQTGANNDPPEAVLAGLRAAVDMPWRSQAERRQIVVITDNPAYPEEVEAAVSAASSFAAGMDGASVSSVFVRSGGESPGTETFLARMASAGGGQAVRAGGSMTANLLLSFL